MKNGKLGCLLWIALLAIVGLWGYKLIDFYALSPAAIKKGINETSDQTSRIQLTGPKQAEYLERWSLWRDSSGIDFSQTTISYGFQGDTFVVQWTDTLHVPVFPSIVHDFRLKKVVI